jgi:predicted DNA-binding protein (MmcQ/YjbR family)
MANKKPNKLNPTEDEIRKFALGFPEATEDFPWGERAIKVRGKAFVFMGGGGGAPFGLSVKLPETKEFALEYAFTEPTHYGLGRHGWVSSKFEPGVELPDDLLRGWISESYRAVAPKTLARQLDE